MPAEECLEPVLKGDQSNFPQIALPDSSLHSPVKSSSTSTLPEVRLSSPSSTMSPEDAPSTSPLAGEEGPGALTQQCHRLGSSPSPTRVLASPSRSHCPSFNLTCMTCHTHFTSAEEYAKHDCVSSDSAVKSSEMNESSGDVERFDGKIVYNPDGSAYIIDSEMSDDDTVGLDFPRQEGSIEDSQKHPLPSSVAPSIPPIANAIYVTKNNRAFHSALSGQSVTSPQRENKVPDVPIVHSYRVFNVGDKDSDSCLKRSDNKSNSELKLPLEQTQVPVKPILMCFICKLSFGYVKSFIAHAMADHSIALIDEETNLLSTKNNAIIQNAGREALPRISFLEPVSPPESVSKGLLATHLPSSATSGSSPSQHIFNSQHPRENSNDVSYQTHDDNSNIKIKKEDDRDHKDHSDHYKEQGSISVKREFSDMFDVLRHQQQIHSSLHSHNFNRDDTFTQPQPIRTTEVNRKSPISSMGTNGRASLSPVTSISPNNFSPMQTSLTQLTGTIIGACPEHMSGRPQGVSCEKCDMILQQSRQIGGQMSFMHSRNSCKTLKCPKCNWHYKYQETLEIHMKEKHPDTESTCIYCLTNQAHPRLARGETYTCGYKPYRCEVCNYSTTTKGNLSIHMQSDKHLNNMQELQNGGMPNMDTSVMASSSLSSGQQQSPPGSVYTAPKTPTPSTTPAGGTSPASQQKPKPMWRCDVCNYETNVARNLRIHMTSEKHTHNMMVLRQNVKHMQQLSTMQGGGSGGGNGGQMDPLSLLQYAQQNPAAAAAIMAGMGMGHEKPPVPEAALADLAYNQALLIQMISGGQMPPGGPASMGLSGPISQGPPSDHIGPHFDIGLNPESLEPPPEPVPPNPKHVLSCCVCSSFHTDSLEQLSLHLQMDRSKLNENEVLLVVAGNYICKLCSYKTNLKANFQLHCKTDKHLQKLQHVNHILEGGPRNEWKLKYLANTNPMHVRCNLCEYYTNSIHKLQLHSSHQRHEVLAMLFRHLCSSELRIGEDRRVYKCILCGFSTKAKLQLLHHIRSVRHLQMEQLHQIQRHAEGKAGAQQDIGDIFRVEEDDESERNTSSPMQVDQKEDGPASEQTFSCSYCSFYSESEKTLQSHIESEHGQERTSQLSCPLCEKSCPDMTSLEKHAINVHSVNSDGLQRLMLLLRLSAASKENSSPATSPVKNQDESRNSDRDMSSKYSDFGRSSEERSPRPLPKEKEMEVHSRDEDHSSNMHADSERSSREEEGEGRLRETSLEREKEMESGSRCGSAAPTPVPRSTPTPSSIHPTTTPPSSISASDIPTSSPAGSNMGVPQQMAEMAAALNALTAAQMQQMHFNPMMMAGLGLAGLPLHLNPLAAMNLQPPLMPMLPHHMLDPANLGNMGPMTSTSSPSSAASHSDQNAFMKQQQQQQTSHQPQQQQAAAAVAAAAAAAAQQKRARTRITDDQLKILRAHFDINNSPSEDQINEMAKQSGLPPKVIKHWFRNTLFKERQRCKDSPYNFSIPPSTTLNLEEYEKTGEAKVMLLNPDEAREMVELSKNKDGENSFQEYNRDISTASPPSKVPSLSEDIVSQVPDKSDFSVSKIPKSEPNCADSEESSIINTSLPSNSSHLVQHSVSPLTYHPTSPSPAPHLMNSHSSMGPQSVSSASSSPLSQIQTSLPSPFTSLSSPQASLALSSIISSQLESNQMLKLSQSQMNASNSGINHPGLSPTPPNLQGFPSTPPTPSGSSCGSGKRANRTRFTDYQIKVLQEFFENNAYPKDDDLEYLSKLLNLSPRVIVVWFQNARQKARKVYENQPPIDSTIDENSGRFTRTPGLNYQCKKCLLVFQRYYELIRHQKTHCFKEEDIKRSAQAQYAAAQAAALYADDNNSNHSSITDSSQHSKDIGDSVKASDVHQCDKCNLTFTRYEQWSEHQLVHLMNPALFLNKGNDLQSNSLQSQQQSYPSQQLPPSPLQSFNQVSLSDISQDMQSHYQSTHPPQTSPIMMPSSPLTLKRKADESEDERESFSEAQRDKRLRTTILPEQLDYLYQKYQLEANPSRKMLETIAQEVGLKKRVVQVWFQNTRARERKGQFRAHAQVINKKCPFCPAIFKVKSALESHLSTKHAEHFSKGEINIDALPDLEDSGVGNFSFSTSSCSPQVSQAISSSIFSPDIPGDSIAKYHEEAIKRYLNDVNLSSEGAKREGETPLDLSKPFDLVRPLAFDLPHLADGTSNDLDNWSDEDVYHIDVSEYEDGDNGNSYESSPTSPASSTASRNNGSKRFRTHMTGIQVKLMKTIFSDCKTPTMTECEILGRDIGLAKRVIQIWFQNARAKEKKAKIALQKVLGSEPESPKPSDCCKVCNVTYNHKYTVQDHIFTKEHIDNMRRYLEKVKEESDISRSLTPGGPMSSDDQKNASNIAHHLQMAQLMALSSQATTNSTTSLEEKKPGEENLSRLQFLQQMYQQMGLGGVQGSPHPLLQHAMMAGAGE